MTIDTCHVSFRVSLSIIVQFNDMLRSGGILINRRKRTCVRENRVRFSQVDPDWFLEMRIMLSDLEGEAIHGMLISDRAEQEDSD